MTPTEQDKELREKIATIVEYWDFSPLQDEDSRIERLKNEIMQLITADRERVALEARIDEVNQLYNEHLRRWDDDECDIYKNRIAELKAQQEEVAELIENRENE